jgi:hypothetical protein
MAASQHNTIKPETATIHMPHYGKYGGLSLEEAYGKNYYPC